MPELPETADAAEPEVQQTVQNDLDDAQQRMVPVTESIRYRKRAQGAEQELGHMRQSMSNLQEQLTEAQETVSHLERRQAIDDLLAESDPVDLHVARLLTEAAVASMEKPDVQLAIEHLRRTKPYLFQHSAGDGSSAMSARVQDVPHQAAQAAQRAAETGDRRDLLRYLRLRRRT